MILLALIWLGLFSACSATTPIPLQRLGEEGLEISHRANYSSTPEIKVHTAQQLVVHAAKYDSLSKGSVESPDVVKARQLRRDERKAAGMLMQEAAQDYEKRKDQEQARATYQTLLTTFTDDEERPLRDRAESSLRRLDQTE